MRNKLNYSSNLEHVFFEKLRVLLIKKVVIEGMTTYVSKTSNFDTL